MKKTKLTSLLAAASLLVSLNAPLPAQAVVQLPDPNIYAIQVDDFYSYSTAILIALGFQGFDFKAGSGNVNLGIFTGNNSINNNNLNQGFPVPVQSPNGNQSAVLNDTWGKDHNVPTPPVQTNTPILVDTVLNYLHTQFGPTINTPVFIFDFNQNQNTASLTIDGQAVIRDSQGNEVKQWSFDGINDSLFEPAAVLTVPATVQFPPTGTPTVGPIASNRGSGKADFINFAPTMDLSQYANQGYTFEVAFNLDKLNGGFEELFLNGAFSETRPVPEPGTMVLMGLGVLGAAFMRKRLKNATA